MKKFLVAFLLSLTIGSSAYAYVVQPGDTLSKIARENKTTVEDLAKVNNIKDRNLIIVGQHLEVGNLFIPEVLGSSYNPVTGYLSRTTQYISASAATIPVASTKDKAGNQISLSNISPSSTVKVYMNLEAGTNNEEPVMCTGVTATSWTNCTRGLAFQGNSETSSSTIARAHNAGASIIITNIGQFFNQYVSVDGDLQINGVKQFTSLPIALNVTTIPTTADQLATKYYVDQVGAGGFTAANVGKGLQALGTVPEKVAFNPASTSTSALGFNGTQATIVTSSGNGITMYNNGLGVNTTSAFSWTGQQTFRLSTTTFSATTSISAATSSAPLILNTVSYGFPSTQGTSSSYLKNDGVGNLTWGRPDWSLVASTTLSGASASTTLVGIPLTQGTDLKIIVDVPYVANAKLMNLQLNADTGANYSYNGFTNATVVAVGSVNVIRLNSPAVSANNGYYFIIYVSNPGNDTKSLTWTGTMRGTTAADTPQYVQGSGTWFNSSGKISSVTLGGYSGVNLPVGTRISVYASSL